MKFYDKSELKHARIFFDQRPPRYMTALIFFLAVFLMAGGFALSKLPKTYIVKGSGTAVAIGTQYVSVTTNGKITQISMAEGSQVKKGDLLVSVSSGQEKLQGDALKKQLAALKENESIYQKFENSLRDGVNYMTNTGKEQEFYAKIEYYLSQLNSESYTKDTASLKLQEKYDKQAELKREIAQAQTDLASYKKYVTALQTDIETVEAEIEKQNASLATTLSSDETEMTSGSVAASVDNQLTKELSKLNEALSEAKGKVTEFESDIKSKNSELDTLATDIRDTERENNAPNSQAQTTHSQLLSELGTTRTTNNKAMTELEANLSVAVGQDKNFQVYAESDGQVHYLQPIKVGMSLQQNQVLAEISNSQNDIYVESYIMSTDISRVKEGASVDVAIDGVNSLKYGTLKGRVSAVDSGTVTQETKDKSVTLYKVSIELHATKLSKDEDVIELKKSMPVTVRIVYDKETYLDWLLEMLNFKQ